MLAAHQQNPISKDDYEAAVRLDKFDNGNMAEQMRQELDANKLTHTQQELLSTFYSGRREAVDRNRIPYATMQRLADTISYESDLAIRCIQALDDTLIELVNEKERKDLERMKSKGGGK